jgi:hypothetical protein
MENFIGTFNFDGDLAILELFDHRTLYRPNPEGVDRKLDALAEVRL